MMSYTIPDGAEMQAVRVQNRYGPRDNTDECDQDSSFNDSEILVFTSFIIYFVGHAV